MTETNAPTRLPPALAYPMPIEDRLYPLWRGKLDLLPDADPLAVTFTAMSGTITAVRKGWESAAAAGARAEEELYAAAFAVQGDAVALHLIARAAGRPGLCEATLPAAARAYAARADVYDALVGPLVPPALHAERDRRRYDTGENATALADWQAFRERLQAGRRGGSGGRVPTGLPGLDELLGGGLHGLTVLAGPSGVGKSALALAAAAHALRAEPRLACLYCSLDMPRTVLYSRLLSAEAGLPYALLPSEEGDTRALLAEAEARLARDVLPRLRVLDLRAVTAAGQGGGPPPVDRVLLPHVNALRKATGAVRVLVVVDYIQLVPAAEDAGGLEADQGRVEALKRLQAGTGSPDTPEGDPVVALSEVRKQRDAGRLALDDVMGSTRSVYRADAVLLLEARPGAEDGAATVPLTLRVAKGRDAVSRSDVPLLFDHTISTFREGVPAPAAAHAAGRRTGKRSSADAARPRPDDLAGLGDE